LAKAKETIDKPVAGLGGKKFEPVRALFNSSRGVLPGTITSIAAKNGYGGLNEVWFVQDENKLRSKELLSNMCEESESNLCLCGESKALDKKARAREDRKSANSVIRLMEDAANSSDDEESTDWQPPFAQEADSL
jgi:hypothetical protein